ncbi:hypothetical protein [Achromobacter aegrifaciens]
MNPALFRIRVLMRLAAAPGDGTGTVGVTINENAQAVRVKVVLRNTLVNFTMELPNNRNAVSTFADSGRECVNPTLTVDTPKAAKEGGYGDVLSFTVVAQP